MANSNAVATVTIQDQDLLAQGLPNLVQRLSAVVTFAPVVGVFYSGYNVVQPPTAINLFGAINAPFVYIRNANTSGGATLSLNYQGTGSVAVAAVSLGAGGIFLWSNSVNSAGSPTGLINFAYAAVGGAVTVEWLYAY